jgi:hypothetical protein
MYILQKTTSEDTNVYAKQKVTSHVIQKVPFKVHEDKLIEEKAVVLRDSKPQASDLNRKIRSIDLGEAVTNLNRQPLQEIISASHDVFEEYSTCGSPMSLDKSTVVSTPVKQRPKSAEEVILIVDEYKEEIYQYLREAEVCMSLVKLQNRSSDVHYF